MATKGSGEGDQVGQDERLGGDGQTVGADPMKGPEEDAVIDRAHGVGGREVGEPFAVDQVGDRVGIEKRAAVDDCDGAEERGGGDEGGEPGRAEFPVLKRTHRALRRAIDGQVGPVFIRLLRSHERAMIV
ncbi:MAG: hypothetical protein RQ966_14645 [Acetobacteraceae bacterium]|nr:hypothetical protein [Acetobacteraceae bacterium]